MPAIQSRSLRLGEGERIEFLNFALAADAEPCALREFLAECGRHVGLAGVARQTFFVPDENTRHAVKAVVDETYGEALPATTFVLQPPAHGGPLAAEIWAFDGPRRVTRKDGAATVEAGGAQWAFVGGIEADGQAAPYDGTLAILSRAERSLRGAGLSFGNAVRTWYYIGDILGKHDRQSRYGLFNRARNEFYRDKWPDLCLSPASTGIGMLSRGILFEGLAMCGRHDGYACVWIDNPLQTPPHRYEIELKRHEQTPSFSRAAAVRLEGTTLIFVSGTASVRNSELLDPDNAAGQTAITLDNIATLIGGENLARHGFARGATLADMLQYRVYVKRPADVERVRAVCEERLSGVPRVEMVSDICWPGFLMEIEGVAAVPLSA